MDTSSSATLTIRDRTTVCEGKFSLCVSLEEEANSNKNNDEIFDPWWSEKQTSRFKIWASNLGVFAEGHVSADYRLRDFDEIRRLILQLLEALDKNLSYLGNIEVGETDEATNNENEPDESEPTEATSPALSTISLALSIESSANQEKDELIPAAVELARSEVVDAISRLNRLASHVRKSRTHQRNLKAEEFVDRDETDGENLTELYSRASLEAVKIKFPHTDEVLQNRLAVSLSRRRNRLAYYRSHQLKLASRHIPKANLGKSITHGKRHPAITSTASPLLTQKSELEPQPNRPHATSKTSASELSKNVGESPRTETSRVSSGALPGTPSQIAQLNFPAEPKVDGTGWFQCPYCSIMCPKKQGTGKHWSDHVMKDLAPYICLFHECHAPQKTYRVFSEWISHMQTEHAPIHWECLSPIHDPSSFENPNLYILHMKKDHAGIFAESQLPEMATRSARAEFDLFQYCPFCNYSSVELITSNGALHEEQDNLQRHIALHLQSAALLSLTWFENSKSEATLLEDDRELDPGDEAADLIFQDPPDRSLATGVPIFDEISRGGVGQQDVDELQIDSGWKHLPVKEYPEKEYFEKLRTFINRLEDSKTPIEDLLRESIVDDGEKGEFLPHKILLQILSRGRVLAKLESCQKLTNGSQYLDSIRPENDCLTELDFAQPPQNGLTQTKTQTYLRTFALLVLLEEEDKISSFINDHVSDQNLPVYINRASGRKNLKICFQKKPGEILGCFDELEPYKKDYFVSRQSAFIVPFFNFNATHYFHDKTTLPWCSRERSSHSVSYPSHHDGGYASVSQVKIHPYTHSFGDIIQKVGLNTELFAVKRLYDRDFNNNAKFQNELEQLQRFNGLVNGHLVTLLATFVLEEKYYFIFPYANGTLDYYWEDVNPNPDMSRTIVQWVSKQLSGLTSALSTIHVPGHLHGKGIDKYGRHGDIKPDNILLFSSSDDPLGILVLSDMGLTAFNSKVSRSSIPQHKVPKVPVSYRAPERDVDGGKISRLYDVWTLGCLYFEIVTWLVGGYELLEQFSKERSSPSKNGTISREFFTLCEIEGRQEPEEQKGKEQKKKPYVAQVKKQVKDCFDKLHNNVRCTQFLHDTLDIIEREMLVIISEEKLRSETGQLKERFEKIHLRCMDDNVPDYCTKGLPMKRLARSPAVVEVTLKEETEQELAENPLLYVPNPDKEITKTLSHGDLAGLDESRALAARSSKGS